VNTIKSTATALALTVSVPALAHAAQPVASDPNIDPQMREFLVKIDKGASPFWKLA
jgi:acetyl esterase